MRKLFKNCVMVYNVLYHIHLHRHPTSSFVLFPAPLYQTPKIRWNESLIYVTVMRLNIYNYLPFPLLSIGGLSYVHIPI